ncbi:MAG: hypothetical protein R3D26_20945 [Cyanobacteriota/Melainabacteria group bacterium]
MSEPVQDPLLVKAISKATKMLEMFGDFYPFAIAEYPNGTMGDYGARDETEQDMIDLLAFGLSESAKCGEIVGAVVVISGSLKIDGVPADGFVAKLERLNSEPRDYYVTYVLEGGKVTIGEIISQPWQQRSICRIFDS